MNRGARARSARVDYLWGFPVKIVTLDGEILNPGDIGWGPIERFGEHVVYPDTSAAEVAERVKGANIVLVNKTPVRAEVIPALAECSLVSVLATGVNNIDLDELAKAGISVCNAPAYGNEDVAQHALALLLEITNGVGELSRGVRDGEWLKRDVWCYWRKAPLALRETTLGIIGFGGIGRALGRMANALGMRVLTPARKRRVDPGYPVEYAELGEVFARSDVISLHCPLTPETAEIINADSIAAMRPGAIVINAARGGLVNERAVAEALKTGKLGGFAADVLSSEPPKPDNPLLTAPNVIITPHMAWAATRARENIIAITAENIASHLRGEGKNVVNSPVKPRKPARV